MNGKPETPETDLGRGSDAAGPGPAPEDNGHIDALPLIARFGGIRPMAARLGVPVSTVQGWKERDAIPVQRLEAIKAAAQQHDIGLTPEDVVLQVDSDEIEAKPAGAKNAAAAEAAPKPKPASGSPTAAGLAPASGSPTGAGFAPAPGRLVLVISLAALLISVLSVLAALFAMRPQDRDVAELDARVAVLEAAIQAPAPTGTDGALDDAVAALADRIAGLEATADAPVATGADALGDLVGRIEALEQVDATTAGGADLLALADRVDTTEQALRDAAAELDARVTAVEASAQAAAGQGGSAPVDLAPLAPLAARLAALEGALGEMAQQSDAGTALDGRLAALEQEMETIGSAPAVDTDRAIGLTLAAIQLRAALGSGDSFEDPYLRAAALAAGDATLVEVLAPLEPLAITGVETLDRLRAEFEPVARRLTLDGAGAEGGWTDRVVSRLNAVVSVRRADEVTEGNEIGARVARARVRLEAEDPAGALAELGPPALGEDDRVTAWRGAVAGRLAVDRAITALETFAYATLAADSGREGSAQ